MSSIGRTSALTQPKTTTTTKAVSRSTTISEIRRSSPVSALTNSIIPASATLVSTPQLTITPTNLIWEGISSTTLSSPFMTASADSFRMPTSAAIPNSQEAPSETSVNPFEAVGTTKITSLEEQMTTVSTLSAVSEVDPSMPQTQRLLATSIVEATAKSEDLSVAASQDSVGTFSSTIEATAASQLASENLKDQATTTSVERSSSTLEFREIDVSMILVTTILSSAESADTLSVVRSYVNRHVMMVIMAASSFALVLLSIVMRKLINRILVIREPQMQTSQANLVGRSFDSLARSRNQA